jgi:hypothetical protein
MVAAPVPERNPLYHADLKPPPVTWRTALPPAAPHLECKLLHRPGFIDCRCPLPAHVLTDNRPHKERS